VELKNVRISEERFLQERKEVLSRWKTGSAIDLDEAVEYQRNIPSHKNFAYKLENAKKMGRTLIRTDSGIPSLEEFIDYLLFLQNEGGADLLGTMVDSMTRYHLHEEAEKKLRESLKTGQWLLNGFPMINYGLHETRKIVEAVDLPLMIRGLAPDYRFVYEMGLASGHTATSGAPLISFSQYSKDISLESVIKKYQYAYRLCGHYIEKGIPITAGIGGGFAILCPFGVLIAGAILDALIAAEQGVNSIVFIVHSQGNIVQDVAALVVQRSLGKEYLEKMGYKDVRVYLDCTSWSGKFPDDASKAYAVNVLGVLAARLAKAEIVTVKTIEEARTIPSKEANASTLKFGKTLMSMLERQPLELPREKFEEERAILEAEVKLLVEKILEIGDGDPAKGEKKATETGMFDVPFATNRDLLCRVKGVRDKDGMVRYLDAGGLPLPREIIDYHREKIREREKEKGKKIDYETIVEDLFSISKGILVG